MTKSMRLAQHACFLTEVKDEPALSQSSCELKDEPALSWSSCLPSAVERSGLKSFWELETLVWTKNSNEQPPWLQRGFLN